MGRPAAVALLSVVVVVAGCGTSQREADSEATAGRFLSAVGDGDTETACALLAPDTLDSLDSCDEAVRGLEGGSVGEAQVWGDRAQVGSGAGTVFLVELAVGWRVNAAGCRPSVEDTYDCELGS